MRSTLFYLPHSLGPLPLFGWGWALIALFLGVILWIVVEAAYLRKRVSIFEWLPFLAIAGIVIIFLLPRMETTVSTEHGEWKLGVPIRGYGLMLLLGALSGIAITNYRAKKIGVSLDQVLSVALWQFLPGMVGARLFYVIQKWDEFPGATFAEKLPSFLKFTEGGLVVYGGVIGGLIGLLAWCRKHRLPVLRIADLIAPGFLLGLAFGRLGCFLHGCCFAGVCSTSLPGVTFPMGSPAYVEQLETGLLLGLTLEQEKAAEGFRVMEVQSESWAAKVGVLPGQFVESIRTVFLPPPEGSDPAGPTPMEAIVKINGMQRIVPLIEMPTTSLRVHPIQIYASINALVICCILFFLFPRRTCDGQVFAIGLMLMGTARFVEEIIRTDEPGFAGTNWTIAQWISIALIILGLTLLAFRWKTRTQAMS